VSTPARAAPPAVGDTAAQALSVRLFRAMLATQESFAAYLGVKLGLYESLAGGGPATAEQLAGRTGLAPRYVREWLEQQATAGLVAVDGSPSTPAPVYRLPPGYERVLTASSDPLSLVSTAMLPLGGVAGALPHLLAAFRTGGGVPAEVFGEDWRHGHGGANQAIYTRQLPGWVRRHLPDVHQRLAAGAARIADVGCGAGWATVALARAYPNAVLTALDLDPAAVAEARDRVRAAGLADRVSVRVADAATVGDAGGHELVCVFDTLHEVARPADVLRACRRLRTPTGTVLVLDSQVAEEFHAPGDEIERFQYATSVLHCLPAALVGDGAAGTGTVLRPGAVRALARQAGFGRVRVHELDDRFHTLYRLDD